MGFSEQYESSWDLYKMELMVSSLGSMLMGELIAEYLDRGFYLLRLNGSGNHVAARFDKGEKDRIRLEMKMHPVDLGSLFAFGGICHITIYKGIQKDITGFVGGQVKEVLSSVGNPEPGVFMVIQDGTSYFVGTTIYFNIKDHMDLESFTILPRGIIRKLDQVIEHISSMDRAMEAV